MAACGRLSQDLAREQIRQAQDGHLPTLNLARHSTGISDTSYSGSKTNSAQYDDSSNMGRIKSTELLLPLYPRRDG